MSWTPRSRPEWVRAFNAYSDPASVVPLDEASLLDAARAATGLDDFGDDGWREGFTIFVRSLNDEAQLHLLGRVMARNEIVRSLVNRLEITATMQQHPEIAGERIEAPLLVTGTGRSGTSILHELLAQDPAHRVARTWELLHPCPPPARDTYDRDPRIARADDEYRFWHAVVPEYQSMHENGGDVPNEDPLADMLEFASSHLMGAYHVPSYTRWFVRCDMAPVFRAHRRFLQLLQWKCRGERWVLKSPGYLTALPAFFGEYPDAYVVVTHRDPLKVLPSLADLMATLVWMHSDVVPFDAIVNAAIHGTAIGFDIVDGWRDEGVLPGDRIIDVRYADFVTDPWRVLRDVYDRTGSKLTTDVEARMRAYLDAKPRGRHGAHQYDFADTGLDRAEMRDRFARYVARYDIPNEV
jgi:hypothetical protein